MAYKEIQEQRMKDYFIQAAKDILRSEGVKSISVRNVANQAGYSYSTLYNHFKDINDLIFLCVSDFQHECETYVKEHSKKESNGIIKLKADIISYTNFFIDYPGIFDLFYLTKVGDFGNKQTTINVINCSMENACKRSWEYCIKQYMIPDEKVQFIKSQLKLAITGLLLFYINRRTPEEYNSFINDVDTQINHILIDLENAK